MRLWGRCWEHGEQKLASGSAINTASARKLEKSHQFCLLSHHRTATRLRQENMYQSIFTNVKYLGGKVLSMSIDNVWLIFMIHTFQDDIFIVALFVGIPLSDWRL